MSRAHPAPAPRDGRAFDLVVVGAGPAGMTAATLAAAAGLDALSLDENPAPGGQIWRGLGACPPARSARLGADYEAGRAVLAAFLAAPLARLGEASVFAIERNDAAVPGDARFTVAASRAGAAARYETRAVILCAGALERPVPVPGWTLPGVMTAGAAQTLLKASALVPDGPTVLAGTGPLLLLLAAQLTAVGAPPAVLLDLGDGPTRSWRHLLAEAPGFFASGLGAKGLSLVLRAARSMRVVRGVRDLVAEGEGRLEAVSFRARGRVERLEARWLLLHAGVAPQLHLALSAGVPHRFSPVRAAFEPAVRPSGETETPGLYVAGDAAGVAGWEAALERGTLAGLAAARALGRPHPDDARLEARARAALRRRLAGRAFVDRLFAPPSSVRRPADNVVLCRCENVTAGQVRALAKAGATGPNGLKAFSRAGMGPCQGRECALSVADVMAEALGLAPREVGHMRVRAPVKPVTLGELAGLAETDARTGSRPHG